MEMPEGSARASVDRFERLCVVSKKDQAASRGHRAAVGTPGTHLGIFPCQLGSGELIREEDFFARITGTAFRTGGIVHVSGNEFFGAAKINAAVFRRQEIKKAGGRIVERSIPVRRTRNPRADASAFLRRHNSSKDRPAVLVDSLGPIQFLDERNSGKKFSIDAIQYIEKAVAICFCQQFARLP